MRNRLAEFIPGSRWQGRLEYQSSWRKFGVRRIIEHIGHILVILSILVILVILVTLVILSILSKSELIYILSALRDSWL